MRFFTLVFFAISIMTLPHVGHAQKLSDKKFKICCHYNDGNSLQNSVSENYFSGGATCRGACVAKHLGDYRPGNVTGCTVNETRYDRPNHPGKNKIIITKDSECPPKQTEGIPPYKVCCRCASGCPAVIKTVNFPYDETCQRQCEWDNGGHSGDTWGGTCRIKTATGYKELAGTDILTPKDLTGDVDKCDPPSPPPFRKNIKICCIDSKTGVSRKINLWHDLGHATTTFRCGNDNEGVDICKGKDERCYHDSKWYNHNDNINLTKNSKSETDCPTTGIPPIDNDVTDDKCPAKYQNDDPYNPKDVDIQFKKKWKAGAAVGGVSGFLLGLIPSKKTSCFLKDKKQAKWKETFNIQSIFPKTAITAPCYVDAFNLTLQTCGKNPNLPCNTMTQAKKEECGGIDTKAKNDALTSFNKCLASGGSYNSEDKNCSFKIELKKGEDKKVLETAYVKAGKHTCNKELFEEYHKKRRNNAILRAGGGAVIGGTAGALAQNEMTKVWRFLKKECGITDKTKAKDVGGRIESETHKSVCELIEDLEKKGGLKHQNAIDCVKRLDAKY